MNEHLTNLEHEIDEALATLSEELNVQPSEAAVYRVTEAVRLELNEVWLANQPIPLPAPEALQRTRQVIHDELQRSAQDSAKHVAGFEMVHGHPGSRGRAWSRLLASLAAAAMIGICVGVAYFAGLSKSPIENIDLFVQAANEVLAEDTAISAILMDLDAIEESIDKWQLSGDYEQQLLDDLGNEIDELFVDPEILNGMTRTNIRPTGAMRWKV